MEILTKQNRCENDTVIYMKVCLTSKLLLFTRICNFKNCLCYKQRYIAGSAKCTTKPLSKLLSILLATVKDELKVTTIKPTLQVEGIRCGLLIIQKTHKGFFSSRSLLFVPV